MVAGLRAALAFDRQAGLDQAPVQRFVGAAGSEVAGIGGIGLGLLVEPVGGEADQRTDRHRQPDDAEKTPPGKPADHAAPPECLACAAAIFTW